MMEVGYKEVVEALERRGIKAVFLPTVQEARRNCWQQDSRREQGGNRWFP